MSLLQNMQRGFFFPSKVDFEALAKGWRQEGSAGSVPCSDPGWEIPQAAAPPRLLQEHSPRLRIILLLGIQRLGMLYSLSNTTAAGFPGWIANQDGQGSPHSVCAGGDFSCPNS